MNSLTIPVHPRVYKDLEKHFKMIDLRSPYHEEIMQVLKEELPLYKAQELEALGVFDGFTRSNGTIIARIYERLTKASRRREEQPKKLGWSDLEIYRIRTYELEYRQGVYDAFKALQNELGSE